MSISISEYEKLRQENLLRNEEFLKKIGIAETKKRLLVTETDDKKEDAAHSSSSSSSRNKRRVVKLVEEEFIPRRSSRHAGVDGTSSSKITPQTEEEKIVSRMPAQDKYTKTLNNLLCTEEGVEEISLSQLLQSLEELPVIKGESQSASINSDSHEIEINFEANYTTQDNNKIGYTYCPDYDQQLHALLRLPFNNKISTENRKSDKKVKNEIQETSLSHTTTREDRVSDDISKVPTSRVTAMMFHPSRHKTVVMCGDQAGHVGIWDASSSSPGRSATEAATTSHFLCKPHSNSVCSLHVSPAQPTTVWSVSLDKTVRYSDIEQQLFVESYRAATTIRDAAFTSPHHFYAGCDGGYVHAVDTRGKDGTAGWTQQAHDNKNIRSIQVHPLHEHCLITSTGGQSGCIAFHDTRMTGSRVWKPLVELSGCHDDLINGIAVSPDGRYLVSVSQDDSLNTWLCEDMTLMDTTPQRRVYFANNYDNRKFLSKIRPVFDPKHPHSFVVGSMEEPRSLYFFTLKSPSELSSSSSDNSHIQSVNSYRDETFLKTLCPLVACHPSQFLVAAGNSSGKVYLIR